jgi:hypothetical protein
VTLQVTLFAPTNAAFVKLRATRHELNVFWQHLAANLVAYHSGSPSWPAMAVMHPGSLPISARHVMYMVCACSGGVVTLTTDNAAFIVVPSLVEDSATTQGWARNLTIRVAPDRSGTRLATQSKHLGQCEPRLLDWYCHI